MPSRCLTDEELSELVCGLAPPERARTALLHVAECVTCESVASALRAARTRDAADPPPSSHAEPDVGGRVGRYELRARIGAGAMGTVFEAHDPALDRRVALKLLRARAAAPDVEARLLREAKAMAKLSHPDVIAVYDAGRDGERLYIAMELVDGGTLRQWLAARPRGWREIAQVFARAGSGLAAAHAAGIVHRDFKPDNVLVGADGRVRVTDFGLARAGEGGDAAADSQRRGGAPVDATLTRTGALVGTPAYMAPEQLAGAPADARSDVYAFCVSLYEALYGVRPFAGETIAALRDAKDRGAVGPPPRGARRVPSGLRRALLAGLRARPEDRPASMRALLRAIQRATLFARARVALGGAALFGAASALAVLGARTARPAPASSTPSTAPASGDAARCTSHVACATSHGGAPYRCRASDGACVAIASEDCDPLFEPGDLAAEDTVWLGAMFPTKGGPSGAHGAMNLAGAEMARVEVAGATAALAASTASLRVRRVALVGCDDSRDPMRAARHLVEDVGVPAILGFGSGKEVIDVAGSYLVGRGVVTVASLTANPLITRLPQPAGLPRMVWRTTYSEDLVGEAAARFVEQILAPLSKGPARVTLARVDRAGAQSFAEAFYRDLRFNGRPAVDNGRDYREVTFPSGDLGADGVARVATRAAEGAPTIVVLLGDSATTAPLVEAIDARAARATPPVFFAIDETTRTFARFLDGRPDRRRRLFAQNSFSGSRANARFVLRYNESHADQVTRTVNPGVTYDAFYLLAYATYALGDAPVTGAALARAFARLVPPGRAFDAGPTGLLGGISELAAGRSIDLQGIESDLDFDLETGEAPSDFELNCADVDAAGHVTSDVAPVLYRTAARAIEGALRCP